VEGASTTSIFLEPRRKGIQSWKISMIRNVPLTVPVTPLCILPVMQLCF
jgi:hypothetical protein